MKKYEIEREYFRWLCSLVCTSHLQIRYSYILAHLHRREFIWTIPNDRNRAIDGLELRKRYGTESDLDFISLGLYLNEPCSVLEMMVALACRCEDSIMHNPEIGDRTGQWFWTMIFNMGLKSMTDDHYSLNDADKAIDILLKHRYTATGENGGLFVINNPRMDMRRTEIWYQMCWWISENYEKE